MSCLLSLVPQHTFVVSCMAHGESNSEGPVTIEGRISKYEKETQELENEIVKVEKKLHRAQAVHDKEKEELFKKERQDLENKLKVASEYRRKLEIIEQTISEKFLKI